MMAGLKTRSVGGIREYPFVSFVSVTYCFHPDKFSWSTQAHPHWRHLRMTCLLSSLNDVLDYSEEDVPQVLEELQSAMSPSHQRNCHRSHHRGLCSRLPRHGTVQLSSLQLASKFPHVSCHRQRDKTLIRLPHLRCNPPQFSHHHPQDQAAV
jgi:hypothetical protein